MKVFRKVQEHFDYFAAVLIRWFLKVFKTFDFHSKNLNTVQNLVQIIPRTFPNVFSDVIILTEYFDVPVLFVTLLLCSCKAATPQLWQTQHWCFLSSCFAFNSLLYLRDSKRRATWEQHVCEPILRFTEVRVGF